MINGFCVSYNTVDVLSIISRIVRHSHAEGEATQKDDGGEERKECNGWRGDVSTCRFITIHSSPKYTQTHTEHTDTYLFWIDRRAERRQEEREKTESHNCQPVAHGFIYWGTRCEEEKKTKKNRPIAWHGMREPKRTRTNVGGREKEDSLHTPLWRKQKTN